MTTAIKLFITTATLALAGGAQATTLTYNDFSSTAGLQINGNAAAVNDGARDVLRVSPALLGQGGSVFSTTPLTFGANYSFSTRFTFNFNTQINGGADGVAFVIQPNANNVGGIGGGIGYQGIGNSLGVEFDNWNNGGVDNNSNNHIGIDLNGNIGSVAINTALPFTLDSGTDLTAWIDYDGATQTLEVRLNNSLSRPMASLLSYNFDLAATIGNPNAFVGFTSATGAAAANHDLVNWIFRDTFAPIQNGVPEPTTWAMLIFGFAAVGGAMRQKRTLKSQSVTA
ncbi:MAG: PEPxxWA-CTERM sorting domain-containing protein [Parasphingorhabdus sp.]|nr:PEPxxWA-CTERM sorting domain-containing protein [Parasphingorhabdus sp.]